jgi:hypothetical protein
MQVCNLILKNLAQFTTTLRRKINAYCLKTLKKPVNFNFKLCIMKNEVTL